MKHGPILIVGAGLSGLMMAAQLLRFGVQPVIIDRKLGPDKEQGHTFLGAKNLELLDQLGILEDLLQQGVRYSQIAIERGRQSIDLEKELGAVTHFPFLLHLPTARLKQALVAFLTRNACKIRWGTALGAATEDDQGVSVNLESADGRSGGEEWRVDWLIGADGPDSLVRRSLGIGVEQVHYSGYLLRAELLLEQDPHNPYNSHDPHDPRAADLPHEYSKVAPIRLFRQRGQWVSLFPLSGNGRYLLMGNIPSAVYNRSPARSLQAFLQAIIGPLPPGQTLRPIPKTIRMEAMGTFRAQRNSGRCCFLIGDAASGPLELTGPGNANGLLDAWNLGWKLAGVVQGRMDKKVLLSFLRERNPQHSLDSLSLFGQVLAIRHRLPRIFQKLEPFLVRRAFARPAQRRSTLFQLSGLTPHYRHSPLSLHYSSSTGIRAGDRFPYLPVYNEKEKTWTDTHRAIRKNGLVLVILGRLSQQSLHILSQWVQQKYPQGLGLYYLPYSNRNRVIFEAFDMPENTAQGILVRPDMHIAYMSNSLSIALFDNYLAEILGWKLYRQFE